MYKMYVPTKITAGAFTLNSVFQFSYLSNNFFALLMQAALQIFTIY